VDVNEFMPRFFVSAESIDGDNIVMTGDNAGHISRSLRMKPGETVTVCDMRRAEYSCVIEDILPDKVILKIVSMTENSTEPPHRVYLYQAYPKGEKFDYIVQKAVELGVYAVIPFISERCVSRPDAKALPKKIARLNRISEEAAKQCGRGIIPEVRECIGFADMLKSAKKAELAFFCYEGEKSVSLADVLRSHKTGDIAFVIGPEGGFSLKETDMAKDAGLALVGLGERILRCETASGFVLSCIAYEKELGA